MPETKVGSCVSLLRLMKKLGVFAPNLHQNSRHFRRGMQRAKTQLSLSGFRCMNDERRQTNCPLLPILAGHK